MTAFGEYSQYYDLLYSDKSYLVESEYIHRLIQNFSPGASSILDLGCGTGIHDILLSSNHGYDIQGIDLSDSMLNNANKRKAECQNPHGFTVDFSQSDIRNLRLKKKFDVVISLFDVMSYQISNQDVKDTFETVRTHLKPGGIFIFDCWYGPTVISDKPTIRLKRAENQDLSILRIAEPVLHPNENCVDVNYHLLVKHKLSGGLDELFELHRMRYFFTPEIVEYFNLASMELIHSILSMGDRKPGFDTWSVCFVGRLK